MSFWERLFAGAVAKMIVDYREESKQSKRWNELYHKLENLEDDMSRFLESVGVPDSVVILDPDVIDKGDSGITQESLRLSTIKAKIREYISLGGHPENIGFYENIDEPLGQLKQLVELGLLEEQDNLIGLSNYTFPIALTVTRLLHNKGNDSEAYHKVFQYLSEQEPKIEAQLKYARGTDYECLLLTQNYIIKTKEIFMPFA